MMRSRWSKWLSGVGGVVLIGGLVLANYGGGVTPAEAHHHRSYYQNPFKQILSKLDAILKILNSPNTGGGSTPHRPPEAGWGINRCVGYPQSVSTSRFTVLADFGNAAVKDNNTGLVWEQSPDHDGHEWTQCPRSNVSISHVGGTKGWRLPSIPELASLIDPIVAFPGPTLPPGPSVLHCRRRGQLLVGDDECE